MYTQNYDHHFLFLNLDAVLTIKDQKNSPTLDIEGDRITAIKFEKREFTFKVRFSLASPSWIEGWPAWHAFPHELVEKVGTRAKKERR